MRREGDYHRNLIVPFEVNVILKLTHLPPFPEYTLDLCSFPRGYGPMRPVAMEGLVIAMTRVTKYTQGARFLCINDYCPCSTGSHLFLLSSNGIYCKDRAQSVELVHKILCFSSNCHTSKIRRLKLGFTFDLISWLLTLGFHHIRVHAPGATESATVGNNFSCMVCSSPLKEDVKFRVLGGKSDASECRTIVIVLPEIDAGQPKKQRGAPTWKLSNALLWTGSATKDSHLKEVHLKK